MIYSSEPGQKRPDLCSLPGQKLAERCSLPGQIPDLCSFPGQAEEAQDDPAIKMALATVAIANNFFIILPL